MRLIIACLLLIISSFSFSQITFSCNKLKDSVYIASDTMYIDQTTDTTISPGFQWLGHSDLSYLPLEIDYNDSTLISLVGGTVTGGLFSPYPYPFLIPVDIVYLQSSIPPNTVINTYIDVALGFCNVPITFIINPSPVSVNEINDPEIEAILFPNPLTSSSTIEVSDEMEPNYKVIIYDNVGKVVYRSENLSSKKHLLNRSMFKSSGIYFIRIESDNRKSKQFKLLVN